MKLYSHHRTKDISILEDETYTFQDPTGNDYEITGKEIETAIKLALLLKRR